MSRSTNAWLTIFLLAASFMLYKLQELRLTKQMSDGFDFYYGGTALLVVVSIQLFQLLVWPRRLVINQALGRVETYKGGSKPVVMYGAGQVKSVDIKRKWYRNDGVKFENYLVGLKLIDDSEVYLCVTDELDTAKQIQSEIGEALQVRQSDTVLDYADTQGSA